MLLDCMFSQPYRSLIESQFCCLDYLNPNSVFESIVTPVRFDISKSRFPLFFTSLVNIFMTFLYFYFNHFFISVSVSLDYIQLCRTVNFLN